MSRGILSGLVCVSGDSACQDESPAPLSDLSDEEITNLEAGGDSGDGMSCFCVEEKSF